MNTYNFVYTCIPATMCTVKLCIVHDVVLYVIICNIQYVDVTGYQQHVTHTSDFSLNVPVLKVSGDIQRRGSLSFIEDTYSSVFLASPKSAIFTTLLSSTRMFLQARSRCKTPSEDRYCWSRRLHTGRIYMVYSTCIQGRRHAANIYAHL